MSTERDRICAPNRMFRNGFLRFGFQATDAHGGGGGGSENGTDGTDEQLRGAE